MKTGQTKHIPGVFPVTTADSVYVNTDEAGGSNKTLQNMIDEGGFLTPSNLETALGYVLQKNYGVLKSYKGEWDMDAYKTAAFRGTCNKGDWWVNKKNVQVNIDTSVLYNNGIVYFDGEFFKTIYVPYTNSINRKSYYDVVIIGGGAGGMGAAYALRDCGYNVAIVERLDTLGGTHCNGVGLYISSPSLPWFKSLTEECYHLGIMGFKESFGSVIKGVGPGTNFDKMFRATQFTDSRGNINSFSGNYVTNNDYRLPVKYYDDLTGSGIDVFINTELLKTNSKNKTIYSVNLRNVLTNETFELAADYFLDCSGDGVLYVSDPNLFLDTDYYIGTDPANRFGETDTGMYFVGYSGDRNGINTVEPMYMVCGKESYAGFKMPEQVTKYKFYEGQTHKDNFRYFPLNGEGVPSTSNSYGSGMQGVNLIERSNEWNLQDGYARALSLFLNYNPYRANSRFGGIRKLLAIREKYRVKADKMLDAFWLRKQVNSTNYVSDRIVALSTWYPDIHNKDQTYAPVSTIANGVPYDSMIPVAYKNCLVACRGAGFSHLCASSIRLVKTMMDMGYSAGKAIRQILDSGTRGDVRDVNVPALQTEIRIAEVIEELETYFYGATVEWEEISL